MVVRHTCLCGRFKKDSDKRGRACYACREEIVYIDDR